MSCQKHRDVPSVLTPPTPPKAPCASPKLDHACVQTHCPPPPPQGGDPPGRLPVVDHSQYPRSFRPQTHSKGERACLFSREMRPVNPRGTGHLQETAVAPSPSGSWNRLKKVSLHTGESPPSPEGGRKRSVRWRERNEEKLKVQRQKWQPRQGREGTEHKVICITRKCLSPRTASWSAPQVLRGPPRVSAKPRHPSHS